MRISGDQSHPNKMIDDDSIEFTSNDQVSRQNRYDKCIISFTDWQKDLTIIPTIT